MFSKLQKLKMPTFITAIFATTYFGAGFLHNFFLFSCFKKFLIFVLNQSWFRNCYSDFAQRFSEKVESEFVMNYLWFSIENLSFSEIVLIKYWFSLKVKYRYAFQSQYKSNIELYVLETNWLHLNKKEIQIKVYDFSEGRSTRIIFYVITKITSDIRLEHIRWFSDFSSPESTLAQKRRTWILFVKMKNLYTTFQCSKFLAHNRKILAFWVLQL